MELRPVQIVCLKSYQDALKRLDEIKNAFRWDTHTISGHGEEVNLRQREGRPVYAIEEDLSEVRAEEKRLSEDKDALELAVEHFRGSFQESKKGIRSCSQ